MIARYNEPLEWVQLVPRSFRIHIYNKGTPIPAAAVGERAQVTDLSQR